MYIPESFRLTDDKLALSFIEQYSFATFITAARAGDIVVTHLPLLLKRSGDRAVLQGHVARANEHWRQFDGLTRALAIFNGPHGYVSPSWYQVKPAVPTWNYAVVHATGCPRAVEDPHLTATILEDLVGKFESRRSRPWDVRELPPDYYEHMARQIVGFEMPIERLDSKFKLGQNRSMPDREGTINGLLQEGEPDSAALATFMQRYAGV